MAVIGTFKRIFKQDFDTSVQPTIEKLSVLLNNSIQVLYDCLTHNASITDNILCDFKDVNVTVDSTGKPTSAVGFPLTNITGRVQGVVVINAVNSSNPPVYPTAGIYCTWQQSTTNLVITNIAGLPAKTTFSLRILAFG